MCTNGICFCGEMRQLSNYYFGDKKVALSRVTAKKCTFLHMCVNVMIMTENHFDIIYVPAHEKTYKRLVRPASAQ